jgi:hypothetical protein
MKIDIAVVVDCHMSASSQCIDNHHGGKVVGQGDSPIAHVRRVTLLGWLAACCQQDSNSYQQKGILVNHIRVIFTLSDKSHDIMYPSPSTDSER